MVIKDQFNEKLDYQTTIVVVNGEINRDAEYIRLRLNVGACKTKQKYSTHKCGAC